MIIAEITVIPIGTCTPGVSKYVAGAVAELRNMGLNPRLTAMGTIFETDNLDVVLKAFKVVHESVFARGAMRVVTSLRIDERRDKEASADQKVRSVYSQLNAISRDNSGSTAR